MASDGTSQFKKVFANIRDAVTELKLGNLPEIAELVRSRIQAQARSGKTMESGTIANMKPLSKAYIAKREELYHIAENGALMKKAESSKRGLIGGVSKKHVNKEGGFGELFSPARSNLTLTGQYLESIQTTKIDEAKAEITIGATGQRSDSKLTNAQLAGGLTKQGRSIWGIDATTRARIVTLVKADIRNAILNNLSKKQSDRK